VAFGRMLYLPAFQHHPRNPKGAPICRTAAPPTLCGRMEEAYYYYPLLNLQGPAGRDWGTKWRHFFGRFSVSPHLSLPLACHSPPEIFSSSRTLFHFSRESSYDASQHGNNECSYTCSSPLNNATIFFINDMTEKARIVCRYPIVML